MFNRFALLLLLVAFSSTFASAEPCVARPPEYPASVSVPDVPAYPWFFSDGEVVCFSPDGTPWKDTCAPGIVMTCGLGGFTYCPDPEYRAVLDYDAASGKYRLFCRL